MCRLVMQTPLSWDSVGTHKGTHGQGNSTEYRARDHCGSAQSFSWSSCSGPPLLSLSYIDRHHVPEWPWLSTWTSGQLANPAPNINNIFAAMLAWPFPTDHSQISIHGLAVPTRRLNTLRHESPTHPLTPFYAYAIYLIPRMRFSHGRCFRPSASTWPTLPVR